MQLKLLLPCSCLPQTNAALYLGQTRIRCGIDLADFLSGLCALQKQLHLHIWRAIFKLPSTWLAQVLQATLRMLMREVQLGLVH